MAFGETAKLDVAMCERMYENVLWSQVAVNYIQLIVQVIQRISKLEIRKKRLICVMTNKFSNHS